MDFWDLTRLLFRRWYIALPMVLLTGYGAYWAATEVKPDYTATAYVQLVPPTPPETKPGTVAPELRNPWMDLGLGSLNTAAAKVTSDKVFLQQLQAMGLSDKVTITEGYPAPIVTFEIVGNSEAQATATTNEVAKRFGDTVVALQKDYGVADNQLISSRRLDQGDNLEEAGGKVKRAVVALVAAGLLLTGALTIAFDALARRRRRKTAAGAVPAAPRPAQPSGADADSGPATEFIDLRGRRPQPPYLAGPAAPPEARSPAVNGGGRAGANGVPVVSGGPAVPNGIGNGGQKPTIAGKPASDQEAVQPISVEYWPAKPASPTDGGVKDRDPMNDTILLGIGTRITPEPEERPARRPAVEPAPEPAEDLESPSDATIVLPMPSEWTSKRKRQ